MPSTCHDPKRSPPVYYVSTGDGLTTAFSRVVLSAGVPDGQQLQQEFLTPAWHRAAHCAVRVSVLVYSELTGDVAVSVADYVAQSTGTDKQQVRWSPSVVRCADGRSVKIDTVKVNTDVPGGGEADPYTQIAVHAVLDDETAMAVYEYHCLVSAVGVVDPQWKPAACDPTT